MRHKELFAGRSGRHVVKLTRHDLIEFEHCLKDAIAEFLPFKSYSLYFPKSFPAEMRENGGAAVYVASEKKVMLPLICEDETLGVFVAKGLKLRAPKTTAVYLAKLASMSLEKLLSYKRSITDPLTGLHDAEYFHESLERSVELVQRCLLPAGESGLCAGDAADAPGEGPRDYSGCCGLVLADIDHFGWINDAYGHSFGDEVIAAAAEVIRRLCPQPALPCRLSGDLFALLWPGGSAAACAELAEAIRQEIAALVFEYPVTGEKFSVAVSLGGAAYPRDLSGVQFKAPPAEQARLLFKKAAKALDAAKSRGRNRYFPFGVILAEGGAVLDALPMGRLAVNLGRSVDAREGQRFLVWSDDKAEARRGRREEEERVRPPVAYKAEIALIEVHQETSFAEVLGLSDPAWPVEPGDRLLLLPERRLLEAAAEPPAPGRADPLTGLYSYRDFLAAFARAKRQPSRFCLAMLRLLDEPDRGPAESAAERQARTERRMRELAALAGEALAAFPLRPSDSEQLGLADAAILGGRFSLNSLVYFLPEADPDATRDLFLKLDQEARARGLELAVGAAAWPNLHFSRSDALENCRKAVDHALLLPEPRVALFDSVSLNISADRLFAHGDLYAAIEEYKAALLADEGNVLARNSLGVCYARLSRLEEAKKLFERALADSPDDALTLYNLGYACQRLGEGAEARQAFEKCLALNPDHVFCLIRLGRLAEERGDLTEAQALFERASRVSGGEPLALRDLARVCLLQGRAEEARELLHQALLRNPQDAHALHLLAKLYLDSGEDPEIAESLARQSATLKPDQKAYWSELARALSAQGKKSEAGEALARAAQG